MASSVYSTQESTIFYAPYASNEWKACLAPAGETWSVMLRQEAALYRPIHATGSGVRILLRLRLEFTNLPTAPPRQDIDIQYSVMNSDLIGWKATGDCRNPEQPFNEEKDVQLFLDAPDSWVTTPAGCFGIFFPEDAHAPQAAEGAIHKVVVKVGVEWAG